MRTATDFVPDASTGSTTTIDIAAPPHAVWRALHDARFRDLPVTALLLGLRAVPALFHHRDTAWRQRRGLGNRPVLDVMTSGRFVVLHREGARALTLGIVGQFWRPGGGDDAPIRGPADFVAFATHGYVKSAIDFVIEPHARGSRLTTRTCSRGTDPVAERRFRRYWRLVGPGSKLIRVELLRAVRSRAQRIAVPD